MTAAVYPALQGSEVWVKRFTRQEYFHAFQEYTGRFGPACMEAVKGKDDAALTALAEELLELLEAGWAKQRIWNRAKARFNDQQLLLGFFSPMLLGLEVPECRRLAELLQERWAARRPKEAYRLTDYATIRDGFHNVILGFTFPDKLLEQERREEEEKNNKTV